MTKNTMDTKLSRNLEQKMQIVGGKALQDLSLKKREREPLNVII